MKDVTRGVVYADDTLLFAAPSSVRRLPLTAPPACIHPDGGHGHPSYSDQEEGNWGRAGGGGVTRLSGLYPAAVASKAFTDSIGEGRFLIPAAQAAVTTSGSWQVQPCAVPLSPNPPQPPPPSVIKGSQEELRWSERRGVQDRCPYFTRRPSLTAKIQSSPRSEGGA